MGGVFISTSDVSDIFTDDGILRILTNENTEVSQWVYQRLQHKTSPSIWIGHGQNKLLWLILEHSNMAVKQHGDLLMPKWILLLEMWSVHLNSRAYTEHNDFPPMHVRK